MHPGPKSNLPLYPFSMHAYPKIFCHLWRLFLTPFRTIGSRPASAVKWKIFPFFWSPVDSWIWPGVLREPASNEKSLKIGWRITPGNVFTELEWFWFANWAPNAKITMGVLTSWPFFDQSFRLIWDWILGGGVVEIVFDPECLGKNDSNVWLAVIFVFWNGLAIPKKATKNHRIRVCFPLARKMFVSFFSLGSTPYPGCNRGKKRFIRIAYSKCFTSSWWWRGCILGGGVDSKNWSPPDTWRSHVFVQGIKATERGTEIIGNLLDLKWALTSPYPPRFGILIIYLYKYHENWNKQGKCM